MTIQGALGQITWTITSPMGNSIPIGSSGASVWKSKYKKYKEIKDREGCQYFFSLNCFQILKFLIGDKCFDKYTS